MSLIREMIFANLEDMFVNKIQDEPLPENNEKTHLCRFSCINAFFLVDDQGLEAVRKLTESFINKGL